MYDGISEYRPAEEVFSEASVASFASAPVTLNHPPVPVTPENAAEYQRGVVSDAAPEVRVKVDADPNEWVKLSLVATHADLIAGLESGDVEGISCGYSCDLDPTPGIAPDGTPYQFIQRNIRINHVAGLMKDCAPRAGAGAKVRLDSKEIMKVVLIDGVEYEVGGEKHLAKLDADHKAALKSAKDAQSAAEAARDAAIAQRDAEKARADAAVGTASPTALDKLVAARSAFLARAAKLLPENYDAAGKTEMQIRKDALTHRKVDLTDKDDVYVTVRFDVEADQDKAQYHVSTKEDVKYSPTKLDSDDAFRAHLAAKLKAERGNK